MGKNHKRDYGRFLAHNDKVARAVREDPDFFKLLPWGMRISRATRERLRMFKRDINRDPLRRLPKVRSADELINRLLDSYGNSITLEAPALIALHTDRG